MIHNAFSVAAVAAVAAVVAIPAFSSADPGTTRHITVREELRGATFVQQKTSTGKDKLAPGDRVITRQALLDHAGASLGALTTDCVNIGAKTAPFFSARLQCTSAYAFEDGQIIAAGTVRLDRPQSVRFPIVGGSGAYKTARGEITPGEASKPHETISVLHVKH